MKKKIFITVLALASMLGIRAQKTENIVVVTMDGLRWQEIFGGADSLLSFAKETPYSTAFLGTHCQRAPPEADAFFLECDCEKRDPAG